MSENSTVKVLPEVLPEIKREIGSYFTDLEVYNRVVQCLIDGYFGVLRDFLLIPGVLDVLPAAGHPVGKPVLMLRPIYYQGQSCMLMAATAAHMRVMIDLMRRCEEDSGCNVITSSLTLPELPLIIAYENIDKKTKMKTKMVSVPVRAEIRLPETVETFTGLVWNTIKQKLVAVRVVVKQESGEKREAFAVIGPTLCQSC